MFPYTDTYAPALFCCDGVMILLIYVFMNSFSGVVLGYIYTIQARLSCLVECENLSDMWLSSLEIGGTQFRSVIKIAPKSPCLWCKQKSYPVWFSRRRKNLSCTVWTKPYPSVVNASRSHSNCLWHNDPRLASDKELVLSKPIPQE